MLDGLLKQVCVVKSSVFLFCACFLWSRCYNIAIMVVQDQHMFLLFVAWMSPSMRRVCTASSLNLQLLRYLVLLQL